MKNLQVIKNTLWPIWNDIRETLHPSRESSHGWLPRALLIMAMLTGIVDAVSYLSLGRVFVSNMTGNVIFVGLGLAGEESLSLAPTLAALAAFLVGSIAAGRIYVNFMFDRLRLLEIGLIGQASFVATSFVLLALPAFSAASQMGAVILLSIAMAFQNTLAQRLNVPGLKATTVLTSTLTGLASNAGSGVYQCGGRRLLLVLMMSLGALAGGALVLYVSSAIALALALMLLAALLVAVWRSDRTRVSWPRD